MKNLKQVAAASARLCVETQSIDGNQLVRTAAASARLCVETVLSQKGGSGKSSSRLRAAVC